LPTDLSSENALVSQLSYYPIDASVVLLPFSLNNETARIGGQAVLTGEQGHRRFLAVGAPECYPTIGWLASSSRGAFTAKPIGDFNGIVVVEFRPIAETN
jgi:hypothetical protein